MAGAGFIIYSTRDGVIKFLGLVGPQKFQVKHDGIFDIPKGTIEPNEEPLKAALRELEEEASIVLPYKKYPFIEYEGLTIYLAQSNVHAKIKPNPESGIIEHQMALYISPDLLIDQAYDYLRPAIAWARDYLLK